MARVAAEYIERERPAFCFVYMGDLDGAGHRHGWLSPEQLARMEEIDAAVGRLIAALERADIRSKTLLIVTSDHGGHGRARPGDPGGSDRPLDLLRPGRAARLRDPPAVPHPRHGPDGPAGAGAADPAAVGRHAAPGGLRGPGRGRAGSVPGIAPRARRPAAAGWSRRLIQSLQ